MGANLGVAAYGQRHGQKKNTDYAGRTLEKRAATDGMRRNHKLQAEADEVMRTDTLRTRRNSTAHGRDCRSRKGRATTPDQKQRALVTRAEPEN